MNAANLSAHLSPWHLFINADVVVKAIMVFLALASVSSWPARRRLARSAR